MKLIYQIIFLLLLTGCGQKTKDIQETNTMSMIVEEPEESLSTSLYFPSYGVYINNWPDSWSIGNHGSGCNDPINSGSFIISSGTTMIGTMGLVRDGALDPDYYSPFEVSDREVIWNKNLDLIMETVGDGKIKMEFRNLLPRYEKWVLQNLSMMAPIDEVRIKEIEIPQFPIIVPGKNQSIELLLDFEKEDDNSTNFTLWLRNRTSRLGSRCEIAKNSNGGFKSSIGSEIKRFKTGDKITVSTEDESATWNLVYTDKAILLKEIKDGKTISNQEIPIPKEFDWTFIVKEY